MTSLVGDSMSARDHTAMLWFFGILAVGALCLVVHAAVHAPDIGFVIMAAGPAAITGTLASINWYARREAREAQARAAVDDLADANEREDRLGR
ncbi:hypothetical protein [Pseudonocardia sp. KRD291]|uniref:hypothetical protein n=1 Tax=Pseudonocardia sp. KRD291 TaxID=2792007 RepID=UPI001C4A4701|nr:hypothetical protein [Pseudonocardia sp. KRD291]MBW0102729.1 hypothetical protein [Pseudonocardia sp. KRD291]